MPVEPIRPARRRRRLIALALLLALPIVAFGLLRWALQPERLGALLLERAARATGLELAVAAPARLGIWPGLQLELIGLSARADPAAAPLLQAERVDVALPLAMLWRRDDLPLGELRLLAPVFDLAAWQAWRTRQPADDAPLRLPDVALDLEVSRGSVLGDGWALHDLALRAPPLHDGAQVTIDAAARWQDAERTLPARVQLQSRIAQQDAGIALRDARLRIGTAALPEVLVLAGEIDLFLPRLRLQLAGDVGGQWPQDWPALPDSVAPWLLGEPLVLDYAGDVALDGELALHSAGSRRQVSLQLRPDALLDWLASEPRSPLPPLDARVDTDALQFDAVHLHGVSVRLQQSPEAAPEGAADD